jgi:outer membrane lipoprotein-sorting protein
MRRKSTLVLFSILVAALLPVQPARAGDLATVLEKLDAAARNFHTTTATFEFDTIQTDPVPDKDVMAGTAYYEHRNGHFEMAAHITKHNNQPAERTYIFAGGVLRVSDTGKETDARAYTQASKYESYLMLGFGASGRELEEKWTIKYLGTEKIGEIVTDKLELIAKDPTVRKNIPKVTIWLDTARAVSLKQVFDEGEGQSRVCYYTNIRVNQLLPETAFSFDTAK